MYIDNTFNQLTLELMTHKYMYYVLDRPIISDYDYDKLEHAWYKKGLELGVLQEGEHTPCIGFDANHQLAAYAETKAAQINKK